MRWKKITFAELESLVRQVVPDVSAGATRALGTAFFMCLPLPDAWTKALTHLRRLREYADHPRLDSVIDAYEAIYDEERDRLWRTRGDLHFASFRVFRQHPASTRTRRRLLVFYGVEALRAAGLPLESTKQAASAYDVMRKLLPRIWPTETRGVAKRESIERAYFRGKEEAETERFDSNSPGVAAGSAGLPAPTTAGTTPQEAGSRYPTAEEFQKYVTGLYLPDDITWIPVADTAPAPRA